MHDLLVGQCWILRKEIWSINIQGVGSFQRWFEQIF